MDRDRLSGGISDGFVEHAKGEFSYWFDDGRDVGEGQNEEGRGMEDGRCVKYHWAGCSGGFSCHDFMYVFWDGDREDWVDKDGNVGLQECLKAVFEGYLSLKHGRGAIVRWIGRGFVDKLYGQISLGEGRLFVDFALIWYRDQHAEM